MNKNAQVNIIDSLLIEQLYQPISPNAWVLKSQVLIPVIKIFGFDAGGSFVKVYSNFNLQPKYEKKYFNNVILRIQDGANKMQKSFWDSIRPVPLLPEEALDYIRKDSLEKIRESNAYKDSIDRKNNRKISFSNIIFQGKTLSRSSKNISLNIPSVLQTLQFNPVEGLVINAPITYERSFTERKRLVVIPHLRYGFSNQQMHAWGTIRYFADKKNSETISLSGGKRIFQLNNENPISEFDNTVQALFYGNNFMNIYSADYLRFQYNRGLGKGIRINFNLQYQYRRPLENTTSNTLFRNPTSFKPNFPVNLLSTNFNAHRSAILNWGITYQPGARYIELPDRSINIGSKWPVFSFQFSKGFRNLLGSDVDFDKWQLSVRDNLNLKLAGRISYRFQTGGFINSRRVEVQDMKHFAGNRLVFSQDYLTTFQLPAYYKLSNTAPLFGAVFTEYHLNGFLTNKIPVIKKLNWHLVTGYSAVWFQQTRYMEWHVGFENMFRILRLSMVQGYFNGKYSGTEFRISMPFSVSVAPD